MNILRSIPILIGTAVVFTLSGCAKFPATAPTTGKQLVLTMQVRGRINPVDENDPSIRRHYFIAIDNENNPNIGPWAVVDYPYGGNGWVTSSDPVNSRGLTSYIRYDDLNPQGNIYGILPGSNFLNTTAPQLPIRYELLDGGSTIRFIVDFSQIATSSIPADQIQQLNINFITTNELPLTNQYVEGRMWDGLGQTGQDYVDVDTTSDRTYSDTDYDGPTVADPDLDIVYWSVEVQTVSNR